MEERDLVPPEIPGGGIYRGWPIAAVTFVALGAVLGTAQFAFGAFILPLEEEFGWTRTQINVSLSLGILTGLVGPIAGRSMDRFGARWVMAVGLCVVSIGFLLRASMNELWQFYLFSAVIAAGTAGVTNLPAGRLVTLWFAKTRGRMMGFVTAGNNFGAMVSVPLVAALIAASGWRTGFAYIGAGMALIMVLAIVVVRDRPGDVEKELGKRWTPSGATIESARATQEGLTTRQATRLYTFWLIMTGMALQQFARTAVATQLIPHLEQDGFSTGAAATAVSGVAFFAMSSKIIFGRLSESITALYSYVIIIAFQIVGLLVIIFAGNQPVVWIGLMTFGLGMGGVGALGPLAVVETFGLRNLGSIMGLMSFAVIVPTVAGPVLAGQVFDRSGRYDDAFLVTCAFLTVSMACFFMAGYLKPRVPAPGSI
ncbi:MAG: MFS transporter [Chloroflexi bacterium]|nr:MFS transporter [Chloroflexota bacterium]